EDVLSRGRRARDGVVGDQRVEWRKPLGGNRHEDQHNQEHGRDGAQWRSAYEPHHDIATRRRGLRVAGQRERLLGCRACHVYSDPIRGSSAAYVKSMNRLIKVKATPYSKTRF